MGKSLGYIGTKDIAECKGLAVCISDLATEILNSSSIDQIVRTQRRLVRSELQLVALKIRMVKN